MKNVTPGEPPASAFKIPEGYKQVESSPASLPKNPGIPKLDELAKMPKLEIPKLQLPKPTLAGLKLPKLPKPPLAS